MIPALTITWIFWFFFVVNSVAGGAFRSIERGAKEDPRDRGLGYFLAGVTLVVLDGLLGGMITGIAMHSMYNPSGNSFPSGFFWPMMRGAAIGMAAGWFSYDFYRAANWCYGTGSSAVSWITEKGSKLLAWNEKRLAEKEANARKIHTWSHRKVMSAADSGRSRALQAIPGDSEFWISLVAYLDVLTSYEDGELLRLLKEREKLQWHLTELGRHSLEIEGVTYTSGIPDNIKAIQGRLDRIHSLIALTVLMIGDCYGSVFEIDMDLNVAQDYAEEKCDDLTNDFRLLLDEIELTIGASAARAENDVLRRSDEELRKLTTGELRAVHAYDEINVLLRRFGVEPIATPAELDLQKLRDASVTTEANREASPVVDLNKKRASKEAGS